MMDLSGRRRVPRTGDTPGDVTAGGSRLACSAMGSEDAGSEVAGAQPGVRPGGQPGLPHSVDAEHLAFAQESLRLLGDRVEDVAADLYAALFLEAPHLRAMFGPSMAAQRGRFARALSTAVGGLADVDSTRTALAALGREHRRVGVRDEHYDVFGEALVAALHRHTADIWVPELEAAWRGVFAFVAAAMQAGAREAAGHEPASWRAVVVAHERRTDDIAVLRLRTDRPYDYEPGQHLTLETPARPRSWRRYSPATSPRADGVIELHVRSVGAGWVSGALVRHTLVGDPLHLGPPAGGLTIDQTSRRDLLMVAGGTGLAPVRSLLEGMARWNSARRVTLLFGVRTAGELYDLPALQVLDARHDWVTVVPVVQSSSYAGEQGTLAEVVARSGPWSDHDVVVCGSPAMTATTAATLLAVGVPAARISTDSAGLGADPLPAPGPIAAAPAVIDLRSRRSRDRAPGHQDGAVATRASRSAEGIGLPIR